MIGSVRSCRERWPLLAPSVFATGVRDAYLDRLCAVRQFRFSDPLYANVYTDPRGCNLMLLDDVNLFVVQVLLDFVVVLFFSLNLYMHCCRVVKLDFMICVVNFMLR